MENKENSGVTLDEILNSIPEKDDTAQNDINEASEISADEIISENEEQTVETAAEETTENSDEDISEEKKPFEINYDELEDTVFENESDSEEEEEEDDEEYLRYIEEERRRRKKRRRRRGHGRFIFGLVFTMIVISIAILCAAYVLKFAKEFLGIGKPGMAIVVEIPMNSSTSDIAEVLQNEGVINNTYLFRFYSKVKGADGTFVAGEHVLTPDMTYENMVNELQRGIVEERESVDILFHEGITVTEAAKKLEENGVCGADEFIDAFNTSDFGYSFEENVKVSALKFHTMEGYLFPDTYTFFLEEDARIVAKKFSKNFNLKITADIYGRMEDLGFELEELLTIASMVQAEANSVSDMKKVASVFLNRLNNPDEFPLLQSDPTRNYVEDIIIPNIEVPSPAMFEAYNTYEGAGLPPGPICNPGLDAINAVLYPADTDYYFFCANVNTGEVFYAETNEEHEANLILAGIN